MMKMQVAVLGVAMIVAIMVGGASALRGESEFPWSIMLQTSTRSGTGTGTGAVRASTVAAGEKAEGSLKCGEDGASCDADGGCCYNYTCVPSPWGFASCARCAIKTESCYFGRACCPGQGLTCHHYGGALVGECDY